MLKIQLPGSWIVLMTTFVGAAACVPAQYQSIPLPASSTNRKQAAATDSENGTQQGQDGTLPSRTTASASPSGAPPGSPTGTSIPNPTSGVTFAPNVPEKDALKKCLNLWGTTPFKEVSANQVKVMDVSVGVGAGVLGTTLSGLGSLLNIGNTRDFESSSEPRLIVIPMSVNVGGATTFELMNPNGWYCLKAAVGAKSTVNIRLHCSARIAQSDLGVSLNTNPTTTTGAPPVSVSINDGRTPGSQLGIMLDSNVSLTRVNSSGGACTP